MNEAEQKIEETALKYIQKNQRELIEKFCPKSICHPVQNPVSLFMAGSPGAGKTEVSKGLIRQFTDAPIRIDADDIRCICPGYTGGNAHLFQKAASKGVNLLYDYALKHSINCILDGTFAYANVHDNITRSLSRNRKVEIWFIYQDPIHAWEFTKAREQKESRKVSKEIFIKAFFESQNNVRMVKKLFGDQIKINILLKDFETGTEGLYLNSSISELDHVINSSYSEDTLRRELL